jgi:hypothetical protein
MAENLDRAIDLLQQIVQELQSLPAQPSERDRQWRGTIEQAQIRLKRAMAELAVAATPNLSLDRIPPELLERAAALGIPLDDVEVRVVIASHDASQLLGILNEIEQKFEQIQRVREYLIVRLPDVPIESMGSRLPVYTAEDFDWQQPRLSPEELAALKAKYQIDRRLRDRLSAPPRRLSTEIDVVRQEWENLGRADGDLS